MKFRFVDGGCEKRRGVGRGRIGVGGLLLLALALWVAGSVTLEAQRMLPGGFSEQEVVAPGLLRRPTAMAFVPDGRLLVCEQGGSIKLVKPGAALPVVFGGVAAQFNNERGLLGIAVDPGFARNGWIYVAYTAALPVPHNRVSRVTASGDVMVAGSERVLFELPALGAASVHNGGALQFGTDGKLYVAVGDNAVSTNAQWMGSLNGKVLRLNADGSIPGDNPFYASATGASRAVWALGLRNPFTFAVGRVSGRMYINDVGGGRWEEINVGRAGANYGWPRREGPDATAGLVGPLHAYAHPTNVTGSMAITGGVFYEPAVPSFPAGYAGRYFYLDGGRHWIRVLNPVTGGVEEFAPRLGAGAGEMPVALSLGPDGALYCVKNLRGSLHRIQFDGSQAPIVGTQPRSVQVSAGQTAEFSVSAFGEGTLAYAWEKDVDGDGVFGGVAGGNGAVLRLPGVGLADDGCRLRCRVTNAFGTAVSAVAMLRVTSNRPPVAVISSPVAGQRYRAGQTLVFAGSASDPEQGALGAGALTWWVDLHHADHVHPAMAPVSGTSGGSYVIPTVGEVSDNVWYRIHLLAVDGAGARHEVVRDVLPEKGRVTLATRPAGLKLTLDGSPVLAPHTFTGVAGVQRTIGAESQTITGVLYEFTGWSDGAGATRTLTTPVGEQVLTANFAVRAPGVDAAAFAGQSVPLNMAPGQTNVVTISFTNTGNTVWSEAGRYRLSSVGPQDNVRWGVNRAILTGAANPGQVATYRFAVVAPGVAGVYDFQWQMLREGVRLFGTPTPVLRVNVGTPGVERAARFVSQTVPARMPPGATYRVQLRFANTGWRTWRAVDGVRLGVQMPMDNLNWGVQRAVLEADVPSGETATFDFNVRAPSAPGVYSFSWRMLQEGVAIFGEASPVISVRVEP